MKLSLYRIDTQRRDFIAIGVLAAVAGLSLVAPAQATGVAPKSAKARKILVLGDSLSAEYGLKRGSGWVALLGQRLKAEKIPATVINASISGDTTAGGRARLGALLTQHRPTHVIIELGGNDALRGLPLKLTQDNLSHMTLAAQNAGAKVLLIGMQVPPNYGKDYGERFAALFASVAKARGAALVPFLLKGVADDGTTRLFQADRIHPKEEAHPIMLANVWPELKKIL
ncbi:MAG: arylesterase [Gammaproteobacteria bacterium]|uniref:arylesterase n=1 Tax=Rhodoferax sp. TaxID=50421 RepID=UPI0017EE96C7|nr:arylesterase [Rhodoferax sp.]MBU3900937.1 arylesterase [Gammaproteobacteria bacterium]MBA3056502.1 arylesterase [Rhodoferax sp.]MBU3996834.1 arylesterase [Gammaproteobacteria bacterium]MBU4017611.1 arylesterase [Gammaproteobacteria bacterium]MBU4081054.1 arylesterase [Gammaproteobacteria bacterium]